MIVYAQHLTRDDISALKRAIARDSRVTAQEMMSRIYKGTAATFKEGETIYTLEAYPESIHVAQLTGRLKDIPAIRDAVIALAKKMGKAYIDIDGRPGWARVLRPIGFKQHKKLLRLVL